MLDTQKQLWIMQALWLQVLTLTDSAMPRKGPVSFTVGVNVIGYSSSVLQKH